MRNPKLYCTWCDDEFVWPIIVREMPTSKGIGVYAACAGQGVTSCPDITGCSAKPKWAWEYAKQNIEDAGFVNNDELALAVIGEMNQC